MSTDIENFRLQYAMEFASFGWRVIPLYTPVGPQLKCSCGSATCESNGKHPRTSHGLKDARTDERVLRAWWDRWPDANVGVVTGPESGLFVLDVDPRDHGDESFDALIREHGNLPTTANTSTGSGGRHFIFLYPKTVTLRNSGGKLGLGLDTRGEGGYFVAPPSLHASGNRYTWPEFGHPEEAGIAEVPQWLIDRLIVKVPVVNTGRGITTDSGRSWLGKALAKAQMGNRNETGMWLAAQLRDNRISQGEAESIMRDYASRVPQGDRPYRESEALATLRSVYSTPPREPAKPLNIDIPKPAKPDVSVKLEAPASASSELCEHLTSIATGVVYPVDFPWAKLTKLTAALLPGTTTAVCGDPGVGKTFWILQALQFWNHTGVDAVAFFIEKDRKFHTMRLLAQLEGCGNYVDYKWLRQNPDAWFAAIERHGEAIDKIGSCIWSAPQERVTYGSLLAWVRQMASAGKRIIIIDPITAVNAGENRWGADDEFMLKAEQIASAHGTSLLITTHPKKGNISGAPTGHDMAAGAAFHRFADTNVWLWRPAKPRKVSVMTDVGTATMKLDLFMRLTKTRNGRGAGHEIALRFGDGLLFTEQGVVLKEVREDEDAA